MTAYDPHKAGHRRALREHLPSRRCPSCNALRLRGPITWAALAVSCASCGAYFEVSAQVRARPAAGGMRWTVDTATLTR